MRSSPPITRALCRASASRKPFSYVQSPPSSHAPPWQGGGAAEAAVSGHTALATIGPRVCQWLWAAGRLLYGSGAWPCSSSSEVRCPTAALAVAPRSSASRSRSIPRSLQWRLRHGSERCLASSCGALPEGLGSSPSSCARSEETASFPPTTPHALAPISHLVHARPEVTGWVAPNAPRLTKDLAPTSRQAWRARLRACAPPEGSRCACSAASIPAHDLLPGNASPRALHQTADLHSFQRPSPPARHRPPRRQRCRTNAGAVADVMNRLAYMHAHAPFGAMCRTAGSAPS